MLIFIPFYWFDKKKLFRHIQFFLLVFTYSNLLRKTNFLSISVILSEMVIFWPKGKFSVNFPKNENNKKHCLAICGSFWGEIFFLLILVPFYCFEQKGLFTTNPNFLGICPFSKLLRKSNVLCISELLSAIVSFLTKKRSFQWISPKMLQNLKSIV